MKKGILFGLFVFVFQITVFAQVKTEEFGAAIEKALVDYELPGLAISIVKDGEVAFQQAYGFANLESKSKLETNALFGIASLSKAFTAAAIAILVDEGKLKWSDHVKDFIPEFNLSDDYVASQMTIEDLLSHRSGFNTFDGDLLWYGTNYSREEIIKRFSKYPMSYDFRTTYGYQNIMFILAGEVVAKVSGMSWDSFIEQRIFKPLNMQHSYTSINKIPKGEAIAMPHVKGELDGLRNYDNSGGAAALISNVEDLSKWIQLWLNNGIVGTDTILSAASVKTLMNMHTPIPPSNFDRRNGIEFKGYGLGWFLMGYEGDKVAHHGGGLPGYISKIFIVPSKNLGGIILSNGETSLPTVLMYQSIDLYIQKENPEDWFKMYLGFSKNYEAYLEKKEKERLDSRDSKLKSNVKGEKLIGLYEDKVYGMAEVKMQGKELIFSMLPSAEIFTSKMTHWQQNTYQIKFSDKFLPNGYLTFELNADGNVIGLKVDLPNPDFHFHNLDFKKK